MPSSFTVDLWSTGGGGVSETIILLNIVGCDLYLLSCDYHVIILMHQNL